MTAGDTNAAFLLKTALDAQVSSDLIRRAVRSQPLVKYPDNNGLARQLAMVASMIRAVALFDVASPRAVGAK